MKLFLIKHYIMIKLMSNVMRLHLKSFFVYNYYNNKLKYKMFLLWP